jgi:16S rRNA (guanine527-N7)-methyltransferase
MPKHRPESPPHVVTPAEALREAQGCGFALDDAQAVALAHYLTLLLKWSRAMNLVGKTGWPEVFRDLAADSLHLAAFLRELPLPIAPLTLDLGAGAGLPGIPLRCVWQSGEYVMVELREKRAIFLRQAVAETKLPRVRVVHGRAEAAGAELARMGLPERADVVVSRAFMPWPKLLPLAAGLLKPGGQNGGGRLVVLANDPPPDEIGAGFTLEAVREYLSGAGQAGGKRRYFWSLGAPASC